MALGINTEAGSFDPFVKFDARAGRWFRKGKTELSEPDTIDITEGFVAMFDLSAIEVGWILFAAGAGPVYMTQPVEKGLPPKPGDGDFKQGFKMRIVLPDHLGGGVHEVASTAKALIGAIDTMHTAYLAAPEAKANKLPIYKMTGTLVIESKGPQGVTRNYAPKLELVGWDERPASLAAAKAKANGQPPAQQPSAQAAFTMASPAATGSTQVPPPQAVKPGAMKFG